MDATADAYPDEPGGDRRIGAELAGTGEVLGGSTPALIRRHADTILKIKSRISDLQDDVAAEYAVAKSEGLDKKALAELVRRLMADPEELREQSLQVTLYETAYHSAGLRDGGRADA